MTEPTTSGTPQSPISYEVTVTVEPELAERFERYMREQHIPQILATGCFREIRFERASPVRFRTSYIAGTHADLTRYLTEHTAEFRADFARHFPMGAVPERAVWETVEEWRREPGVGSRESGAGTREPGTGNRE